MKGRLFKSLIVLVTALLGLVAYVMYTQFMCYQGAVDRVIGGLTPEEHDVPTPVAHVFEALDGPSVRWLATRGLLLEVVPEPATQGAWHLRQALWGVLLPIRISRRDMIGLYAHYMTFEGGQGLS